MLVLKKYTALNFWKRDHSLKEVIKLARDQKIMFSAMLRKLPIHKK